MSNSALSSRNYLIYLIGGTISLHGMWIYRVALGWYAWQLSGSELWVGIVAFTQFAPAVVFGPIFGVLADRFDRRAASILINSMSIINMLLLGLLTYLGSVDILVLTMLSLMQGVLDGAHMPVRMAIVPNLISKIQLQSAIALTSISFNLSRFIGPAIAGIIIAKLGVAAAFTVNGVSYIAFIISMVIIRLVPSAERKTRQGDAWQELKDGVRYVRHHQPIRAVLVIIALASVFGRGALEMLPAFADAVYQGGSSALAVLTSAIGAGAIVSGLALSRGTKWLTINVVRMAAAAGGFLIAILGTVDNFHVAVGIVTSLGVILSLCGVGSQILVQTMVDDEVRGRVSSLWGMVAFGGTALGGLIIGSAATVWGLQNSVIVTGTICCVAAAMSYRASGDAPTESL
jgi:MFS family permease